MAGNGIIHSEIPGPNGGEGFQLWLNLPSQKKFTPARYNERKAENVPFYQGEAGNLIVKIVAGSYQNIKNDDVSHVDYTCLDVNLSGQNSQFTHKLNFDQTVWFYVYEGEIVYGQQKFGTDSMVVLSEKVEETGSTSSSSCEDKILIKSTTESAKFFLCHSNPINEKILWHGPFVVNQESELEETFEMYQSSQAPFQKIPGDDRNF